MAALPWNDPALQVASDNTRVAAYRSLQSWYREHELNARYGSYTPRGRTEARPVGSLLYADDVVLDRGLNFIGKEALAYAEERAPVVKAGGGSLDDVRLFHNMLSSMPLCFSIFGELRSWPDKGLSVVRQLIDHHAVEVLLMECEWKPQNTRLGDRTAFDAVVVTRRQDGTLHLTGIETKYTEPFSRKQYDSPAYAQVHAASGWFQGGTESALVGSATNQLWRNTLLAATCELEREQEVASASVCVLALAGDQGAVAANRGLSAVLAEPATRLRPLTLEDLAAAVRQASSRGAWWADVFTRRYLDLEPVGDAGLVSSRPT